MPEKKVIIVICDEHEANDVCYVLNGSYSLEFDVEVNGTISWRVVTLEPPSKTEDDFPEFWEGIRQFARGARQMQQHMKKRR